MKKSYLTVLASSILLMLSFLKADGKEKTKDDFLIINPNIQNEELRFELEELRKEFNIERNRIKKYYNDQIDILKEERQNKIKIMKTNFGDLREIIRKKYSGEKHDNSVVKPAHSPTVKNVPDQKKVPQNKKKNRKP